MKKVLIVGPRFDGLNLDNYDVIIGVDGGSTYNLSYDVIMGDFDSVSSDKFNELKEKFKVISFNKDKDYTDGELAIKYCQDLNYTNIDMIGFIDGNRIDHLLTNIRLLFKYEKLNITLLNNFCEIKSYSKGNHTLHKKDYKYLSIYTDNTSVISISGVKYPLISDAINFDDSYLISNEFVENVVKLEVERGKVVIITSKEG